MENNNTKLLIKRVELAIQRKQLQHAHAIAQSAHRYRSGRKTISPYLKLLLRYEQLLNKLINSDCIKSFIENNDLGKICRQYCEHPEQEQEIFALLMPCAICKESLYQQEIKGCLAGSCTSFIHSACLAQTSSVSCPVCRGVPRTHLYSLLPYYPQNFILIEKIFLNQTPQYYFIKSITIHKEEDFRRGPTAVGIRIQLNSEYSQMHLYDRFITSLPQQVSYKKKSFSLFAKAASKQSALVILEAVLRSACQQISPCISPARRIAHQETYCFNNQPLLNALGEHLTQILKISKTTTSEFRSST